MKTIVTLFLTIITNLAFAQCKVVAVDEMLIRSTEETTVYSDNSPYIDIKLTAMTFDNSKTGELTFVLLSDAIYHKKVKLVNANTLIFQFDNGFQFFLSNGSLHLYSYKGGLKGFSTEFNFGRREFDYFLNKGIVAKIIMRNSRTGRETSFKPINPKALQEMFECLDESLIK